MNNDSKTKKRDADSRAGRLQFPWDRARRATGKSGCNLLAVCKDLCALCALAVLLLALTGCQSDKTITHYPDGKVVTESHTRLFP